MKITLHDEQVQYNPAGHYNMTARRAHSKDMSGSEILTIGCSTFNPGGGAEASPVKPGMELVYYVIEGTLTVTCEGQDYQLQAGDSIFFKAGEIRSVKNNTEEQAVMLVISGVH
ncbi:MAG: cupin domain-containing protein [Parasporobacterium sp.]|nr:cupin domain-containing protein [Parasporobacterium sp.]